MKKSFLICLVGCLAISSSCIKQNIDPFSSKGEGDNTFGFYYYGVQHTQEGYQGSAFGPLSGIAMYSAVFESEDDIVLTANILPRYSDQVPQMPISIQLVGFKIPCNSMKEQEQTIQLSGNEVVVSYYSRKDLSTPFLDESTLLFLHPVNATVVIKKYRDSICFGSFSITGSMDGKEDKVELSKGIFDIAFDNHVGSSEAKYSFEKHYAKYLDFLHQKLSYGCDYSYL